MIPTPPTTPVHSRSSPRSKYPNSTRYWQDRRQGPFVDIGVQTPSSQTPSSPLRAPRVTPPRPNHVEPPTQPVVQKFAQPLELSEEQRGVLELVKRGKSIFFTGPAGTGKSVLLREIIRDLRATLGVDAVAVTATTGIAGVNIGGSTVHSFAGIGLGKESAQVLAKQIINSNRLKQKWCQTQVLLIDEISMMDGQLFDKLEEIARTVRKSKKPFGGLQLVLSGDFFQLPPVPEKSHNYQMPSTCTFDALKWSTCITQTVHLTQVFRQKDNTFIDLLASMRVGKLSEKNIEILGGLSRSVVYEDGIEPSEIFPLRREVESCNNTRMAALPGVQFEYNSIDRAGFDYFYQPISKPMADQLLDRLVALPKVILKVGARVMLIQNIIQGVLVNGSAGKVADFVTTHEAVARGIKVAEISRKGELGEQNQGPSFSDMRPLNKNKFGRQDKWPLVQFTNGHQLLCAPVEFTAVGHKGNTEASRLQVPLILAWAMSIHKSQGQTLERVKVDLGRVFEKGQAYVAVSRATSMDHLQIVNLDPAKILAHPRVIQWHQEAKQELRPANSPETVQEVPEEMDLDMGMLDSEEAISRYWDDVDDWDDTDSWNDSGDIFSHPGFT